MKESLKQTLEFCNTWEKNFDSSLKAIKKFKEDTGTRPLLTPTTEQKYEIQLNLLMLELTEMIEIFQRTKAGPEEHNNHE